MPNPIENIAFRVTPSVAIKLQTIASEKGVSPHLVARSLMLLKLAEETGDSSVLEALSNPQKEHSREVIGLLRQLLTATRTVNNNVIVTAIATLTDAGQAELPEAQQFADEHLERL